MAFDEATVRRAVRDPLVTTVVVEHRYRFARFAAEYIEASLSDQNRTLVVVDAAETADDLVRGMTEILTSLGARLYGKPAAANKVRGMIEAGTAP